MEYLIKRLKFCIGITLNEGKQTIVDVQDIEKLISGYLELEKENTELKQALEISKRLYESKCNEIIDNHIPRID